MRFKANEAAQTITGPYRRLHPEDNNERQAIHEHVSVPLPILAAGKISHTYTGRAYTGPAAGTHGRQVDHGATYTAVNSADRDTK
jgi:hypothetical protein